MQATQIADLLVTWPQHQMEGISQQHLGTTASEFHWCHTLYRAVRAAGLEYRCFDAAVGQLQSAATCLTISF